MINWDSTYEEQVKALPDANLLAAYQRTSGEPGVADADALLAEIKRRNLDV